MKSDILVGPPKRGGTVTNPSAPDEGGGLIKMIGYLLPVVLGGGLGALEGLAAAGKAEWWRGLSAHIKWSVFATLGGALLWLENYADDDEVRSLAAHTYGSVSGFATMYGVIKAIDAKASSKTPEPKVDENGKPITTKGLGSIHALAEHDARDAEAAVRELVRRRAEWAPDPGPALPPLGEIQRQFALGEITLEPGLDVVI